MGFSINKVKVDLCSYPPYMLLAPKKFGKTTFWHRLVKEAWGSNERGLLVSFGNEEGYHSLDGIQVEVAKNWTSTYDDETGLRGFVEIVDDIVENNDKYQLKGVCFDTLDTMVDVCTKEVLRQHKKEKGTPCKTLNEAFSGYGRGKLRLFNLIDEQVERLRDMGICIFYLCHIKNKEKTDLASGEKYEQITNNLTDDIFSHFADSSQIVMVGVLDREINGGKIISEERVVYLRGNSTVDAGGRFTDIPEKIELSPKAFLEAFEYAVKHSMENNVSDKEIKKMKAEEDMLRKKQSEIRVKKDREIKDNCEDDREVFVKFVVDNFSNCSDNIKAEAKKILADSGCKKFTDTNVPIPTLKSIVKVLGGGDLIG